MASALLAQIGRGASSDWRNSAWDGDGGLSHRVAGRVLAAGDGGDATCPSAPGVARLPTLRESATLDEVSATAEVDLGGRGVLTATGGSLAIRDALIASGFRSTRR